MRETAFEQRQPPGPRTYSHLSVHTGVKESRLNEPQGSQFPATRLGIRVHEQPVAINGLISVTKVNPVDDMAAEFLGCRQRRLACRKAAGGPQQDVQYSMPDACGLGVGKFIAGEGGALKARSRAVDIIGRQ